MEQTILAMLPKEKVCSRSPGDECFCADCGTYNQAIRDVHALVPAIIEAVYEDLSGKIFAKKMEYHNLDSKRMTYEKHARNKVLDDVLFLLSIKK